MPVFEIPVRNSEIISEIIQQYYSIEISVRRMRDQFVRDLKRYTPSYGGFFGGAAPQGPEPDGPLHAFPREKSHGIIQNHFLSPVSIGLKKPLSILYRYSRNTGVPTVAWYHAQEPNYYAMDQGAQLPVL
jgi:hypothetical protein